MTKVEKKEEKEEKLVLIHYNFQRIPDFLKDSPEKIKEIKDWISQAPFLPDTVKERLTGLASEIEEEEKTSKQT